MWASDPRATRVEERPAGTVKHAESYRITELRNRSDNYCGLLFARHSLR